MLGRPAPFVYADVIEMDLDDIALLCEMSSESADDAVVNGHVRTLLETCARPGANDHDLGDCFRGIAAALSWRLTENTPLHLAVRHNGILAIALDTLAATDDAYTARNAYEIIFSMSAGGGVYAEESAAICAEKDFAAAFRSSALKFGAARYVSESACACASHLVSEPTVARGLCRPEVLQHIANVTHTYAAVSEVVTHTLELLSQILGRHAALVPQAWDMGLHDSTLNALKLNPGKESVVEMGTTVLRIFAEKLTVLSHASLGQLGALDIMVSALVNHEGNLDIVKDSCQGIRALTAIHAENKSRAIVAGAQAALERIMVKYKGDDDSSIFVLAKVALDTVRTCPQNKKKASRVERLARRHGGTAVNDLPRSIEILTAEADANAAALIAEEAAEKASRVAKKAPRPAHCPVTDELQRRVSELEARLAEALGKISVRENECEVCMDAARDVALSCGHILCHACARDALRHQVPSCPFCRAVVSGFQRVYV